MNWRLFALILVLIVGGAGAFFYFRPREKPAPIAPALMTVDPAAPYDDGDSGGK